MKKEIMNYILDKEKNLIVNGAISTGKTRAISFPIVDKIIENKENLLILDAKEEYVGKYYNKLKEQKYNVITINLKDFSKSDTWNFFEYPYSLYREGNVDRAIEYIENIGRVIFDEGNSVDPFWTKTSTDFFIGLTLLLFNEAGDNAINLDNINSLLDSFYKKYGSSDFLTSYFNKKGAKSVEYLYVSSTILAPNDTKESIIAIVKQKIASYVSSEKLSNLLRKTSFKIEDIFTKPTVIFIVLREENNKYNELASIFIEQLFQMLIDKGIQNKFNFVLDNIDTISKIENLNNMLSSGLCKNIKFYLLTRSLEELNNKYSTYINKLSNIIKLTNHTMKITIEEDIDIAEENLGNNEVIKYPDTIKHSFKEFNLETSLIDKIKNEVNKFDYKDIDKLLVEIDRKIVELEQEEKQSKKDKKKIKTKNKPEKKILLDIGDLSTDELIKRIDKRLFELEQEEKNSNEKIKQKQTNFFDNNKISVDELIVKIDKKLEELEQKNKDDETKKESNKNDNTKNIIDKINEKIKELEKEENKTKKLDQKQNDIFEFDKSSIDELIVKIDKKLEELEHKNKDDESKKESNKNDNIKDIIDKINEKIKELEKEENKTEELKQKQTDNFEFDKSSIDELIVKIDKKLEELEKDNKEKENKKEDDKSNSNKDIINKINEKLKELEKEEKNKLDKNSISEFQQFKIEKN